MGKYMMVYVSEDGEMSVAKLSPKGRAYVESDAPGEGDWDYSPTSELSDEDKATLSAIIERLVK